MQPIEGLSDKLDARNTVLLGAADLIEKRGWCRFKGVDDHGRLCTIGAITVAADVDNETRKAAFAAITAQIGDRHIATWNDWQPLFIGKRRVIRALRAATKQPLTV